MHACSSWTLTVDQKRQISWAWPGQGLGERQAAEQFTHSRLSHTARQRAHPCNVKRTTPACSVSHTTSSHAMPRSSHTTRGLKLKDAPVFLRVLQASCAVSAHLRRCASHCSVGEEGGVRTSWPRLGKTSSRGHKHRKLHTLDARNRGRPELIWGSLHVTNASPQTTDPASLCLNAAIVKQQRSTT